MINEAQLQVLLSEVVKKENVGETKRLLELGAVRGMMDENGQTVLHHAVATQNLEIVKVLLEDNLRKLETSQLLMRCDNRGKTALHLAAENYAIDIIRYLRGKSDYRLDNIKDKQGFTPLDNVRILQTMRKTDEGKFSPEEMNKISKVIQTLIENPESSTKINQLNQYIKDGKLEKVKELINKNPRLLESRNRYTNTPLFEAVYNKQFQIAHYLIDVGADVNAKCFEGKTALHKAVWVKDEKTVLKLLDARADIEALNDHGGSPLLDAAGTKDNAVIIEILLKRGAKLDVCNAIKRNIIHLAAEANCSENIQYFFDRLNNKEMFEQPDGLGRRPLHLAAERNYFEVIQILYKLGCQLDLQDMYGRTAFHLAAEKNHINALQELAKLDCKKEIMDEYGQTAAHLAAEKNHVEALQCLLTLGCKMNVQDKYFRTPLHLAAAKGSVDAAEYLLKINAELEAVDNKNRTPLHLAARNGQLKMIKYLIKKGADLSRKDSKERTPLVVAKTHQGLYKNQTEFQEACDWLSGTGIKEWNSHTKYSNAPQGFHYQRQTNRTPRVSSKKKVVESWRPKKP